MEKVYLQDSVAVTKFIYWLKKNIGKMEITEITASDYLEKLRREIPEFWICPSQPFLHTRQMEQ